MHFEWDSPKAAKNLYKPVVTVSALVTVGFSFDDEPTINSQDELTVATLWVTGPQAPLEL